MKAWRAFNRAAGSITTGPRAKPTWSTTSTKRGRRRPRQVRRRADAAAFRDTAGQEVRAGVHVAARDAITVGDAVKIWLVSCAAGRGGRDPVRQVTLKDYCELTERHVLLELGTVKLSDITAPRVVAFRDWLWATAVSVVRPRRRLCST